jgi:SRSO17 transposase
MVGCPARKDFFESAGLVLLSHKIAGEIRAAPGFATLMIRSSRQGGCMSFSSKASEARFAQYVEELIQVIGHADRAEPLRDYCTGLLLPAGRKSVEPIAAMTAPARVSAKHQSLLHFVGKAPWSDEEVMAKVQELVLPVIERAGPVRAWIVDDTGVPKKGEHSVGVARQYCGQLGKQDNCQVAVTLSLANDAASLPIAHRLYLPESWSNDAARRQKAGVPDDIIFKTKPEIALDQIRAAHARGAPHGVVLADSGYGKDTNFRTGVTELALSYVVGVQSSTSVWRPGEAPLKPKRRSGRGRPTTRLRRSKSHKPISAKDLAFSLPARAWKTVAWRQGSNVLLSSRFAALRLRPAHRDQCLSSPHPVEWLLIEWPKGQEEPTKYWLSTLPENTPLKELVDLAKLRWRIERDYQDLKQEIGLGHYEGRSWRGFHHHATLSIAAYGFLISERETIPPSRHRFPSQRQTPFLPENYRPRGSPDPNRTPHPSFHSYAPTAPCNRARAKTPTMSLLPPSTANSK